ncbi:hypothetical protein [Hyphomonas sp.]|uniref:hypothetical protein n=1 Tax=Hyphomonas sp. TaxID=87 RepID=UPI00391997A3
MAIWVLSGCAAAGPMVAEAPSPPPYLQKDIADLAAMRAGLWSDDRQVFFWGEAGYAGEAPVGVTEWEIRPASDGGLVSVLTGPGAGSGELRHSFEITGSEIEERIGGGACVIRWKRRAGGFAGVANAGECTLLGAGAAELFLTDADMDVRVGGLQAFRRARTFTCWAAILRGAVHGDSGEGMSGWDFRQGLTLHDQGGDAVLESDETPPRTVRLKLRDVDWPHGARRGSLTLYVLEGASDRAVSYAWTGGGEDRIGINLRWLQASCTRDGAEP